MNIDAALKVHQLSKVLKVHQFKKIFVEWVIVRWQTQRRPKEGSKDSECCYWVLWTDMRSIWKSSEIFLLISVELHKSQETAWKKTHWIETVWTPVCSRRKDKKSIDPKQKLNKGPKCTMIKDVGDFSGGGGISSLVWTFWQRWL